MRKLNKTETEIMEEIRTQGFAVIMSGYRTLRKRGSYGNRRHNAAIRLRDVFGLIKTDYVENVDDKKLLTEAISGMVSSLDPHSVYLDAKAFREMRETVSGKFVGIGIEVGNEDGYIKVISPETMVGFSEQVR